VESQVQRDDGQRAKTDERAGSGEPSAEGDVRRSQLAAYSAQGHHRKKTPKIEERREWARYSIAEYGVSERWACRTVNLNRCTYRRPARESDDLEIQHELRELAERHPRWGCRKMTHYLRNQGRRWNHKRIRRVYCEMALNLYRKPKKRLPARAAQALVVPAQPDRTWSLDFMSDTISGGRTFRTLNVIDDYNREALGIEIDISLPGERVIQVLERLMEWREGPQKIRMDNGPELISGRLENWAAEHNIELIHIQPGKPAQNAYIERFNRTFREEVLDAYIFDSLEEVRIVAEQWLQEYNQVRPHQSLEGLSPRQFAIHTVPVSFRENA